MRVWRLTRSAYSKAPLSGEGALRAGSRWNSAGVRMAYTSTTRALALLELLVHVTRSTVPADLVLIPIDVPGDSAVEAEALPGDWNGLPFSIPARQYGDRWIRSGSTLGLIVPSVIVPHENNLLINPVHPGIRDIKIHRPEPFGFDARLFR